MVSIIGRFLEHSRIFYFENGGSPEIYVGSADLMERNLDRRVEVLFPILDRMLLDHLKNVVLDSLLADNELQFILQEDGSFRRKSHGNVEQSLNAQSYLLDWYAEHKRQENGINERMLSSPV